MKKTIALLLALIICLFLCACGGDHPSPTMPPKTTPAPVPTQSGSHISDHPFVSVLYGVWERGDWGQTKPLLLTFSDTGDCGADYDPEHTVSDHLDFKWWVDEENSDDQRLQIRIANTERVIYLFALYKADNGGYAANLTEVYEGGAPDMLYDYSKQSSQDTDPEEVNLILGHWEATLQPREDQPKTFDFFEDRTCLMDGQSYTWKFDMESGDDYYRFNILDEGRAVAFVSLYFDEKGFPYFIYSYSGPRFMKPEHYEVIEITAENWSEYFEIIEDKKTVGKNEFGDLTGVSYLYNLQLKEVYAAHLSELHHYNDMLNPLHVVTLEVSYQECQQPVEYDAENNTFRIAVQEHTECYSKKRIVKIDYIHDYYNGFGRPIDSFSTGFDHLYIEYLHDFEVTRAMGQIVLIRET